jgi:hypothetical protein
LLSPLLLPQMVLPLLLSLQNHWKILPLHLASALQQEA